MKKIDCPFYDKFNLEAQAIVQNGGIYLLREWDHKPYFKEQKYFKEFLEYIALDEKQFWKIIDKFRSPHLWKLKNKKWKLKKTIY